MSQDTNSVKAGFNLTEQQIEEINRLFTSLEEDDTECESSHVLHSIGENNMLRMVPIVAPVSNTNLTIQHGIQVFWKQEKVFDSTEQEKAGEKPSHMILECITTAIVKSYDFLSIGIGTHNYYGRDYKYVKYIKTADNIFPKFGIEFKGEARKCILVSNDTFDSSNVPIIASAIDQINTALKDLLNRCGYTDPVNTGCSTETPIPLPLPHSSADACTTLSNLSDAYFKQIDSFEPGADDDIGFYIPVFPRQMTNIINTIPKTSDDVSTDITEKSDWKRDVLIMLKLYHVQYTEHKNSIHLLLPKDDIAEHAIRLICQRPNINTAKLFTFGNTTALKLSQNMTCV